MRKKTVVSQDNLERGRRSRRVADSGRNSGLPFWLNRFVVDDVKLSLPRHCVRVFFEGWLYCVENKGRSRSDVFVAKSTEDAASPPSL